MSDRRFRNLGKYQVRLMVTIECDEDPEGIAADVASALEGELAANAEEFEIRNPSVDFVDTRVRRGDA